MEKNTTEAETVVETGGMTAAGNVLHLTQAAVSQQMKKLEEQAGEPLFRRNGRGVALTDATTFQGDLEWDSLTVMDFVAAIEDEFDIIITMNMQAEIETVGQLVDAVGQLRAER